MTYTNQQVFDKALFGIRMQAYEKSYGFVGDDLDNSANGTNGCRYRSWAANRPDTAIACGIGQSIPDDRYKLSMENVRATALLFTAPYTDDDPTDGLSAKASELRRDWAPLREMFTGVDPEFAGQLQSAHDNANGPASFEWAMQQIASRHGLHYTPPQRDITFHPGMVGALPSAMED